MKREKALWIFDHQVDERGLADWLKAHTSFLKPLHRYEGEIRLKEKSIELIGKNVKTDEDYSLDISRKDVLNVDLGYDEVFRRREERSLGVVLTPLRIEYKEKERNRKIYLFINYRRFSRRSSNGGWFRELASWMAH